VRAATILRIVAVLAFVQFALHTALFLTSVPHHGAEEEGVIATMRSHHFMFGGMSRSYWDFYYGYGLLAAVVVLAEAALFWCLAIVANEVPRRTRPMIVLLVLYNLTHAAIMARYFFPLPIIMDGIVAATLLWAYAAAGRE
jgi:hypothetical protein